MAAELAKYIKDQLATLPTDHRDRPLLQELLPGVEKQAKDNMIHDYLVELTSEPRDSGSTSERVYAPGLPEVGATQVWQTDRDYVSGRLVSAQLGGPYLIQTPDGQNIQVEKIKGTLAHPDSTRREDR
jgi:hypothetical protein